MFFLTAAEEPSFGNFHLENAEMGAVTGEKEIRSPLLKFYVKIEGFCRNNSVFKMGSTVVRTPKKLSGISPPLWFFR